MVTAPDYIPGELFKDTYRKNTYLADITSTRVLHILSQLNTEKRKPYQSTDTQTCMID